MVSAESSTVLFRLSGQVMGTSMNTVLPCNISHLDLPDKFNKFFTEETEMIRSNVDSMPRGTDSGALLERSHSVSTKYVKQIILKETLILSLIHI